MTEIQTKETCTKCLGAGTVANTKSLLYFFDTEKHCWKCNGKGKISIPPIFTTKIIQGNTLITLIGQAHKRSTIEELEMETETFYKKHRSKNDIPSFPHFEVEILNADAKFFKTKRIRHRRSEKIKLHVHSVMDKKFMRWTGDLPSLEVTQKKWETWCQGSAWSYWKFNQGESSYDFAQIMGEKFEQALKEADILLAPPVLNL